MNSEEAKDILQLCRPDHAEDLDDPLIKEAFEKLEQDSELCAWFEEQQIVDAAIFTELSRIAPPSDLKTSILAGMQERVVQSESNPAKALEKIDPPERATETRATETDSMSKDSGSKTVWFQPLIGIAAMLLFASILYIFSSKGPTPQVADENLSADKAASEASVNVAGVPDIVQFISQQIADFNNSKFDKRSEQVGELQSYLARYGMPNPSKIPQNLESAATIGCVLFNYGNTPMSMICFKNGRVYHLITLEKAKLDKNSLLDDSASSIKIYEYNKQAFKVWSKGEQIYILSVEGTKENLPEFI